MSFFEIRNNDIVINVRIVPRAGTDAIQGVVGDELKIRIKAPPVDGKANIHLIKYLSKHWKVPRAHLTILSGKTGRNKRICIVDPPTTLHRTLAAMKNGAAPV